METGSAKPVVLMFFVIGVGLLILSVFFSESGSDVNKILIGSPVQYV